MAATEKAKTEFTGDASGLLRAADKADKRIAKLGKSIGKSIGGALNSVGGAAGALAGIGGGLAFADLASSAMNVEETLTRIGIQAGMTDAGVDGLRSTLQSTATAMGVSREELVGGVDALVNLLGASAANTDNIAIMGKAMAATGAQAEDIAGLMFTLSDSYGIKDAAEMERALSSLTAQGKDASITLPELSKTFQQQGAAMLKWSDGGVEGIGQVNAALQTLRKGSGSATEAGTLGKALVSSFSGAEKKLKRFGVRVFDVRKENGKTVKVARNLRDIIEDMSNSKLARDPALMQTILGGTEAANAADLLIKNRGFMDDLAASALKYDTIQRDANKFLSSSVGRQKAAMNELKTTIEGIFTPEVIEGFSLGLRGLVDITKGLVSGWLEWIDSVEWLSEKLDKVVDSMAEISGLNDKLRRVESAPQLLTEQATAFGGGKIAANQQRALESQKDVRTEGLTTEQKAARQILMQAQSAGLVDASGKVNERLATAAFLNAQGVGAGNATPAQRDNAAQAVAGLTRAAEIMQGAAVDLRAGADKVNSAPVTVDVKVSQDGSATAAARGA